MYSHKRKMTNEELKKKLYSNIPWWLQCILHMDWSFSSSSGRRISFMCCSNFRRSWSSKPENVYATLLRQRTWKKRFFWRNFHSSNDLHLISARQIALNRGRGTWPWSWQFHKR